MPFGETSGSSFVVDRRAPFLNHLNLSGEGVCILGRERRCEESTLVDSADSYQCLHVSWLRLPPATGWLFHGIQIQMSLAIHRGHKEEGHGLSSTPLFVTLHQLFPTLLSYLGSACFESRHRGQPGVNRARQFASLSQVPVVGYFVSWNTRWISQPRTEQLVSTS